MTMRSEGEKRRLPEWTFLMSPRIICSQALKSAITPSRRGRITRILLFVFSYIFFASVPTAIIFSVWVSSATTDGSLTEISPSDIITVLAVPRSMASSWVKEKNFENSPIVYMCVLCLSVKLSGCQTVHREPHFDSNHAWMAVS